MAEPLLPPGHRFALVQKAPVVLLAGAGRMDRTPRTDLPGTGRRDVGQSPVGDFPEACPAGRATSKLAQ